MTAVGYCRVSTDQQAREGVSLEAQESRLEAWAQSVGRQLVATYVDAGASGSRADNRAELQRAIGHACKLRAPLVVYSLSRLARSTRDALEITARLSKCKADLVSLTESIDTTTAAGKMMLAMLAAFAEFERNVVSERTKSALRFKRARGELVSRLPRFGQYVGAGGRVVPHPDEQKTLGVIRALRNEGRRPGSVTAWLNRAKIPTRTGGKWHRSTVTRIMREEGYL